MNKQWVVDLVERLPQGLLSRMWGQLARFHRPRAGVGLMKRVFVHAVGVDMSEAEAPIGEYRTLEDLFLRHLRPGVRRIDPDPTALVSPVDATVGAYGTVHEGTLLQVKGRTYSLARLLDDPKEAERFEGGHYATLYLSPKDYHRIHAPVSGQVASATIIPGALMPVFAEATAQVDELFARNERIVTYLDSPDAGRVAVVKVGAMMVGRIRVAYDPTVHTNRPGQLRRRLQYDPPQLLSKGAELGAFEMGSTVVLVTEAGRVELDGLEVGATVRMGQRLGVVAARKRRRRTTKTKKPTGEKKVQS